VESISDIVRFSLAGILALFAALHAFGPGALRNIYRADNAAISLIRVIALPLGLAAAFLVIPHTHIWGVAFAAITLFSAIVALLLRERYGLALLGTLVLTALPLAILAGPLS
jgi:hypothetical protein